MFAPELRIVVSRRAIRHLNSTKAFGLKNWGNERAENYQRRIMSVFETLQRNPMIGFTRDELGRGIRTFPVATHVIVYRASHTTLTIVAVLHSHSDLHRYSRKPIDYPGLLPSDSGSPQRLPLLKILTCGHAGVVNLPIQRSVREDGAEFGEFRLRVVHDDVRNEQFVDAFGADRIQPFADLTG